VGPPISHQEVEFEQLYRQYHREVLAYCARRLPPSEAFDAAAEAFTIAWRRRSEIPDAALSISWIYGVAHRVVSNHLRSTRRRARLANRAATFAHGEDSDPATQVIAAHEQSMVVRALLELGIRDREILMLATWEELAPLQIARVLGISRAAVDQRLSRARRRLAQKMIEIEQGSDARANREGLRRG
jgi:RNA polymerase sigma factor (sigma-70 family)